MDKDKNEDLICAIDYFLENTNPHKHFHSLANTVKDILNDLQQDPKFLEHGEISAYFCVDYFRRELEKFLYRYAARMKRRKTFKISSSLVIKLKVKCF